MGCGSSAGKNQKYSMVDRVTAVDEIKHQMMVKDEMHQAKMVLKATRRALGEASPSPSPMPLSASSRGRVPIFSRLLQRGQTTDSLMTTTSIAENACGIQSPVLSPSPSPSPTPAVVTAPVVTRGRQSQPPVADVPLPDRLGDSFSSPQRESLKQRKKFVLQELNA
jgi:hypothetical protein